MTPPRRAAHPQIGPLRVAFEAPDAPAWLDDDALAPTVASLRAGLDHHRRQLAAEGRPAGAEAPAKAGPKQPRRNEPLFGD